MFNQYFFCIQHDSTGPFAFITETQLSHNRMNLTLMGHIGRGRSKQAQSKQKQEDQDGTFQGLGRRLAKLKGAMKAVREFSAELGMTLLHRNRCSGCNTSRGTSDEASEFLPWDPFVVNQTVAKRVLGVLKVETAGWKSFAYEDMDENSSD